ncbi:hypothetical protein Sango_1380000 [Sesamum angolense]|uniref:DUF4408 domain-containing protein n=1 Tax=Sesamum angolense TaxID=2727404 RepID=A0AAE1WT58_9LAMI|nr:hypothetical protein Sango_1380000 [Sesamum angolense]
MECATGRKNAQPMKAYMKGDNFVLYSLTSFVTCLFFSYSFWFPTMKHVLFLLRSYISLCCNAKCFFIVGNLIILVLVRESRAAKSSHPCLASDTYDEYVARSGSLRKVNSDVLVEKKEEDGAAQSVTVEEKIHVHVRNASDGEKERQMRVCQTTHHEEKKSGMRACKSEVWGESEIEKWRKANGEKEDQPVLPQDELNKRVEAFIARVNKQRLFEAKSVDHGRG